MELFEQGILDNSLVCYALLLFLSSYACNGISWDEKGAREKTAICH